VKVVRAAAIGFCHGIRRAVKLVEEATTEHGTLYCLHDVAHNHEVMHALQARGVVRVDDVSEIPNGSAVAVTAHGATQEMFAAFEARGLQVVDATCPIVLRAQQQVAELASEGRYVIVYGSSTHQEVLGLLSHASQGGEAQVDASAVMLGDQSIGLVAQTTREPQHFRAFADTVCKKVVGDCRAEDTTCAQPMLRYQTAVEMADTVDAFVVIGSKTSANCTHLAERCEETGKPTFFIDNADEIDPAQFEPFTCIGLAAGASTPDNTIDAVEARLLAL